MVIEYTQTDRPEFTPVDEGVIHAVCVDNVDLGIKEVAYQGESKNVHKMKLIFEVPDQLMPDGRSKTIGKTFTASLAQSANLRKALESWLGRPLNADELASCDLDALIGKTAKLLVLHKEIEGRTMHVIETIQPSTESVNPSGGYVRWQDREVTPNQNW